MSYPDLSDAKIVKMKIIYDYIYPKTCFKVEDDVYILENIKIYGFENNF